MSNCGTAVAPSRALTPPCSKRLVASQALSTASKVLSSVNIDTSVQTAYRRFPIEPTYGTRESETRAARDQRVLDHLHLVKVIASSIRKSIPVNADFDDIQQAGMIGLIDAAGKYDGEKHNSFAAYAKHRIRGAILDSLRQLDWASRDMRRRQKLVTVAMAEFTAIYHRNPTETEVADKVGLDLATCRQTLTDLRRGAPVSSSQFAGDNEDLPAPDFAGGLETRPDFICEHEQLQGVLREAVRLLPERYQKVILMYYGKSMTMKEIGGVMGINESRVSQIHKVALAKMATALQANGIASYQDFIN